MVKKILLLLAAVLFLGDTAYVTYYAVAHSRLLIVQVILLLGILTWAGLRRRHERHS
jgi:hypothetical protein